MGFQESINETCCSLVTFFFLHLIFFIYAYSYLYSICNQSTQTCSCGSDSR